MGVRVLVVDDSVVIRRLVVQALEANPEIEIVGTAANGALAIAKYDQLKPDAITMDIEMPEMNGVEAVRALRKRGVRVPIIMFSTLTARGATATLDALAAGATDYVTKPANVGSVQAALAQVGEQLGPKLLALAGRGPQRRAAAAAPAFAPSRPGAPTTSLRPGVGHKPPSGPAPVAPTHPVRAVVVGSSTGGPEALSHVLRGLTSPLPVPVLITQHMPPLFTAQLAHRLDRLGPSTVVEAEHGQRIVPGTVYIAPGDTHMEIAGRPGAPTIAITHGDPVNFCRPSVDVMFRSAVAHYGGELLAVVLTGMGSDGRTGAGQVVTAGGTVIAQDEQTSVVWGMPGAVVGAGLAHKTLPLAEVASSIAGRVARTDYYRTGGRS